MAEAERFAAGKITRVQLGGGAGEVGIEGVVFGTDVDATGVEPPSRLMRTGRGPKQVVLKIQVARSLVVIGNAENRIRAAPTPAHGRRVVAFVEHIVERLAADAVEIAAAGATTAQAAGVARNQQAIVAVIVRKETGQRRVRSARAPDTGPVVPGNDIPVASGIANRVVGERMAAVMQVFLGAGRQRIEVMAGIINLVNQAVVNRVPKAANVQTRSGAEANRAVQETIVVAADVDAGLAGLDRVATFFNLPGFVMMQVVREVGEVATIEGAKRRLIKPRRRGANRQAADNDVRPPGKIERERAPFHLHAMRFAAIGRNEIKRVALPNPFTRLVERVHVAHDHPHAILILLGILRAIRRSEPPRPGPVADMNFTGLGTFNDAGLHTPRLVMFAAVKRTFPIIVRLAIQQLAHDAARIVGARLRRNRELAKCRPER